MASTVSCPGRAVAAVPRRARSKASLRAAAAPLPTSRRTATALLPPATAGRGLEQAAVAGRAIAPVLLPPLQIVDNRISRALEQHAFLLFPPLSSSESFLLVPPPSSPLPLPALFCGLMRRKAYQRLSVRHTLSIARAKCCKHYKRPAEQAFLTESRSK
eukprot:g45052.t1